MRLDKFTAVVLLVCIPLGTATAAPDDWAGYSTTPAVQDSKVPNTKCSEIEERAKDQLATRRSSSRLYP